MEAAAIGHGNEGSHNLLIMTGREADGLEPEIILVGPDPVR
jgi:hypothetical protein